MPPLYSFHLQNFSPEVFVVEIEAAKFKDVFLGVRVFLQPTWGDSPARKLIASNPTGGDLQWESYPPNCADLSSPSTIG